LKDGRIFDDGIFPNQVHQFRKVHPGSNEQKIFIAFKTGSRTRQFPGSKYEYYGDDRKGSKQDPFLHRNENYKPK
jgi:hypothetical protein